MKTPNTGWLRDLRKRVRLSQADLAQRLNVDISLISRWEKGERQPSPDQLRAFARIVGVSLDFLLNADIQPQFQYRAVSTRSTDEEDEINRAELDAVQQIHALHTAYKLAGQSSRSNALSFDTQGMTDADLPDFVAELRTLLKLNRVVSLDEFKQSLADQHIHVFEWYLPRKVSGLSYRGLYSVIFINRQHTVQRRLFTLAHELAHVLFHLRRGGEEGAISVFASRDPKEKEANAFAAELLMPTPAIKTLISTTGKALRNLPVLDRAAQSFNVSRDALFYRLMNQSESPFTWADKKLFFTEDIPTSEAIDFRVQDISQQTSPEFLQLALSLYDESKVSAGKLSEWFFASRPVVETHLSERSLEDEAVLF